jgi:uncharacterized metal-binding protein YceD (DUF177 family)
MTEPAEFSRLVAIETLGNEPRHVAIAADEAERAALSSRFGLAAIHRLTAEADLTRSGASVTAAGALSAAVTQNCVASGEPVEAIVDERFRIEFRPQPVAGAPEEEIELGEEDLDVVFYAGEAVDLGEAAAETLSLSLDPYPRSPEADAALRAAGVKNEEEAGPFAALAALRDQQGK